MKKLINNYLLSPKQVQQIYGITVAALKKQRQRKKGATPFYIGTRVFYDPLELTKIKSE